jgi:hypothetical protein
MLDRGWIQVYDSPNSNRKAFEVFTMYYKAHKVSRNRWVIVGVTTGKVVSSGTLNKKDTETALLLLSDSVDYPKYW